MSVVEIEIIKPKKRRRQTRASNNLIRIDRSSAAGRFFHRTVRAIEAELSSRAELTHIDLEMIHAFAGTATLLRYWRHQMFLGDIGELDPHVFAKLTSTLLRLATKLKIPRRASKEFDMQALFDMKRSELNRAAAAERECEAEQRADQEQDQQQGDDDDVRQYDELDTRAHSRRHCIRHND